MVNLLEDLNNEQRAVVTGGNGPCLVLAGAGSGKTRTITYRVAYLLERGVAPDRILLVTFTNKAAKEMISRVERLTNGAVRLPWSGTFHHIGYRLLARYAPTLGYRPQFTILDSEDSRDLLKLCLKQEGIDRAARRFPSAQVVQSIISYARNAQTTIHDVVEARYLRFLDVVETIERIAEDYDKRKRAANAMDFDDLLVNLFTLLTASPRVLDMLAEQFQYVLVDEYQDTNKVQAAIVRLLAAHHRNVLVVGDDAQSIYSFRAADIQNILAFEKEYPDAKIFRLETNYRSTPEILRVANDVIAQNVQQYEKVLRTERRGFGKPEVRACADPQEEAEQIAARVLELRDEGVPLSGMAVLFRAAFHSQALEMELAKRDIPYDYRGGVRFFERAHIKDVLGFLRVRHNQTDTVAWSRVLSMQIGIGPSATQFITDRILAGEDLREIGAQLPARAQAGWQDFLSIWQQMDTAPDQTTASLIHAVIDSKYQEYVENEYPDARDRLRDLEQLATFAERQPDVQQFLADASLQESYAGAQVDRRADDDGEGRLVLSTIHQAKGLEWDAVFLLHLAQGKFPDDRARGSDELEEERRLFYVAVTRAKTHLSMSYPLTTDASSSLSGPSVFLEEIAVDAVDHEGTPAVATFFDPSDDVDDIVYEKEPQERPRSLLKSIEDL